MGTLDGKIAIVTGTSHGVGVGIAHELLRAGATVIGCSRSKLDALPGVDAEPDWASRSAQLVCDQGDYRAIDALLSEVASTYGRIDILVNNAGGTVPTPHVEDVPALVQQIQGAPRSDDDFERTALFHSFVVQMNLISPLWFAIRVYRQMRDQDGTGSIISELGRAFAKLGRHIGEGLDARRAAAIGNMIWATLRGLVVAQLVIPEPLDTRRERRALVDMVTAYVDGATA